MYWALIYWPVMIIFQTVNILFHTVGLYLLKVLRRNGHDDNQFLLVMNLSASEIILNQSYIVLFTLSILQHLKPGATLDILIKYFEILSSAFINFVYYFSMIYIAINKMLEVQLNIKYQIYCSERNVKRLLYTTWISGFMLSAVIMIMEYLVEFHFHVVLTYFYTTLDIMFIFVVGGAYIFIFHRYRLSRINLPLYTLNNNSAASKQVYLSYWKTFKTSRFHLPCFLIITYLLFTIFPKLIAFFIFPYIHDETAKIVSGVHIGVLYHLSFLLDAVIYVFMLSPVKRLLLKKLRKVGFFRRHRWSRRNGARQSQNRSPPMSQMLSSTGL